MTKPAQSDWGFLKITLAAPKKAEITVYEQIGPKDWDGNGVDASSVQKQLADLGPLDEISIRINSPGGNAFHGLAIYNILKTNSAKKIVYVDGVAASAASIIAMAGDEIVMNTGSLMMIHEAAVMAWGQKKDLELAIKLLDATNTSAVRVYQEKTGLKEDEIRTLLAAETWMTDEQAVSQKFADRVNKNTKAVAAALDPQQWSQAPEWVRSLCPQSQQTKEPDMSATTTQSPATEQKPAETKPAEGTSQQTPAAAVAPKPETAPATPVASGGAAPVDLVAKERERSSKIVALCGQSGHPELAAKWIEDPNMTVESVTANLLNVVCQDGKPVGDGGGSQQAPDPTAAYKKEYAEQKAVFSSMGITEEQYVDSRLVDSGEKTLATSAK